MVQEEIPPRLRPVSGKAHALAQSASVYHYRNEADPLSDDENEGTQVRLVLDLPGAPYHPTIRFPDKKTLVVFINTLVMHCKAAWPNGETVGPTDTQKDNG